MPNNCKMPLSRVLLVFYAVFYEFTSIAMRDGYGLSLLSVGQLSYKIHDFVAIFT